MSSPRGYTDGSSRQTPSARSGTMTGWRCAWLLVALPPYVFLLTYLNVTMGSWPRQHSRELLHTRGDDDDNINPQTIIHRTNVSHSHVQNTTTATNMSATHEGQFCAKLNEEPLYNHNYKQEAQEPSKNNRTDYNILILTPFWIGPDSNMAAFSHRHMRLLCSLNYPHHMISIAVGLDSAGDVNTDHNLQALRDSVNKAKSFNSVDVYELRTPKGTWTYATRHVEKYQLERRRYIAMARNNLLFQALRSRHDWVLWLDSDLSYIPPNLIQLLLSPNEQIVVPAGVMGSPHSPYDLNTWRETKLSLKYIQKQRKKIGADFLMVEGYGHDYRLRLSDLVKEGKVVRVDGVGGMALLVNASCHRNGLMFPTFVLDSHIETEGLAKMATKMGIRIVALPFVNVFHKVPGL